MRTPAHSGPGDLTHLRMSAAEARILLLVARGLSTREIAHDFRVCQQTVTYHLSNLMRRLQVANRVALVAKAYADGLFAPGPWPPTRLGCVHVPVSED